MEGHHHAAKVLTDEFREELGAGVACGDVVGGEDFVGEVGAGFEGEGFREDEGVVAVEEEGCELLGRGLVGGGRVGGGREVTFDMMNVLRAFLGLEG